MVRIRSEEADIASAAHRVLGRCVIEKEPVVDVEAVFAFHHLAGDDADASRVRRD